MPKCGECYYWLRKNSCPHEKGFQKGGPNCNSPSCDKFKSNESMAAKEKVINSGPAICVHVPKSVHQFSNRTLKEQYHCELVEYKYPDVTLMKMHVHRNNSSGGPEICDLTEFKRWFKTEGWQARA